MGLTAVIDKATAGFSFLAPTDDAWEAFGQAYNLTTEDVLALPYLRGILMYAVSRLGCCEALCAALQPDH